MKNWRTKNLKNLAQAFLAVKDQSEMENFLRDLCTSEELEEMSARWEVVLCLAQGESYREIAKKTKVSTTTVTRIAQWLNNGEGGYKMVLSRILKGNE
ncbi:MAG: hypothetical protein ACD_72C00261G0009 [uncultured bacterium]|nr:MAG: hypothetical protein ACD_72C00261G0009 [uncultured bacterium]